MLLRSIISTAVALVALFAVVSRDANAQAFVFDARSMVADNSYDSTNHGCIGGSYTHGGPQYMEDSQVAVGLTITSKTHLTHATVDLIAVTSGADGPVDGFLVEVFPNIAGDHPAESPAYSKMVSSSSVVQVGTFGNGTNDVIQGDRITYAVDLSSLGIALDPGTWWISVTPRNDSDVFGTQFLWVGNNTPPDSLFVHTRCGGIDHGNNYNCWGGPNSHPDWFFWPGGLSGLCLNVSIRIEGDLVQGACCMATHCALAADATACGGGTFHGSGSVCVTSGTPATCCPADFNGSGSVTVQDIFDFLSAWFAHATSADFNHSGSVTVQDIFDFLSAWFAHC